MKIPQDLEFLFEASFFASQIAQEVQAGAAYFTVPFDDYFFDAWAENGEGTLNADAITGNSTNSETGAGAVIVLVENGTFKFLNTLAISFFNFNMHTHQIAGT